MVLTRAAPPSARALLCPACGTRSFRAVRRGLVEIDVCASCLSVYFDDGEARTYLRQALVQKLGAQAVETSFDAVDGLGSLLELIASFLD